MKNINFRFVFVLAGIMILIVVYILLWMQMISSPEERTAADFIAFYAAGKIADSQGNSFVYDLNAETKAETTVINTTIQEYYASTDGKSASMAPQITLRPDEIAPFPHPPFILPLLQLVARQGYVLAFEIWACFQLVFFILSAFILIRLFPQAHSVDRWILFLGTLLFFPCFFNIVNGQDAAILLIGASLWMVGLLNKKDTLSGLGLALTTIRPQMALVLSIPFIFKRRRIWWAFCAGAAVLVIFSFLLIGRQGTLNFLQMMSIYTGGEGFRIYENLMINLIGLLHRISPSMSASTIHLIGWAGFGLALVGLSLLWARSPEIKEKHIGLMVIVCLFTVPHAHYNELVLLLIPLYGVMRTMGSRNLLVIGTTALLPLGLAFFYLLTNLSPFFKFNISYLVMILMLVGLWFPERLFFWKKGAQSA